MTNHNIKFSTFRNEFDLGQLTEQLRLHSFNYVHSGLHFVSLEQTRKIQKTSEKLKYRVSWHSNQNVAYAQSLLEEFATNHNVDFLKVGHRIGEMNANQCLFYIFLAFDRRPREYDILAELLNCLEDKLSFEIKEEYINKKTMKLHGDIVAMNSSTLRGIIAHD